MADIVTYHVVNEKKLLRTVRGALLISVAFPKKGTDRKIV